MAEALYQGIGARESWLEADEEVRRGFRWRAWQTVADAAMRAPDALIAGLQVIVAKTPEEAAINRIAREVIDASRPTRGDRAIAEVEGIAAAIAEWRTGCSNGRAGECLECTVALVEAIEKKAARALQAEG
jgi:hypothetical protein